MDKAIYSVITGTGCYIPTREIPNQFFLNHEFFDASGKKLTKNNEEIIHQFFDITTRINKRSLMGFIAPEQSTVLLEGGYGNDLILQHEEVL